MTMAVANMTMSEAAHHKRQGKALDITWNLEGKMPNENVRWRM